MSMNTCTTRGQLCSLMFFLKPHIINLEGADVSPPADTTAPPRPLLLIGWPGSNGEHQENALAAPHAGHVAPATGPIVESGHTAVASDNIEEISATPNNSGPATAVATAAAPVAPSMPQVPSQVMGARQAPSMNGPAMLADPSMTGDDSEALMGPLTQADIDQWTASMDAPPALAPLSAPQVAPTAVLSTFRAPVPTPRATSPPAGPPPPTVLPTAHSPPADRAAAGSPSPSSSRSAPPEGRDRRSTRSVEPSTRVMRSRRRQ